MIDPRTKMGLEVESAVCGPYEIRSATRNGTGNDGGSLDQAIMAWTVDGRQVVIGEIWAAGIGVNGSKIRLDAKGIAESVVTTLNRLFAPPDTEGG